MDTVPIKLRPTDRTRCTEFIRLCFKGISKELADGYEGPYFLRAIGAVDMYFDRRSAALKRKYIDDCIDDIIGVRLKGCRPLWGLQTVNGGRFLPRAPCEAPDCRIGGTIYIHYEVFVTPEQLAKLLKKRRDNEEDVKRLLSYSYVFFCFFVSS